MSTQQKSVPVKEALNKSSGKQSLRSGMGCKAQTGALADASARICNTADHPSPQMNALPGLVQTFLDVMDTHTATQALHRAAEMARKTAIDTDTCLIVMENDKVIRIPAQQLRQQQKRNSTTG